MSESDFSYIITLNQTRKHHEQFSLYDKICAHNHELNQVIFYQTANIENEFCLKINSNLVDELSNVLNTLNIHHKQSPKITRFFARNLPPTLNAQEISKMICKKFPNSTLRRFKMTPKSGVINIPELLVNKNEILTKATKTTEGIAAILNTTLQILYKTKYY